MTHSPSAPAVGLMLPATADTNTGRVSGRDVIASARAAEATGFDGVYVGDHLLHRYELLESIVTLSAVAGATQRVSLGSCVMLFGLREPLWLAKQLGSLASYAPGRLRVGVGVGGEYPAEFEAAGVPLSGRGARMESVLLEVRRLMRDGVDVPGATLGPRSADVPFLLAGWKEPALRRAATHGDGWIGYLLAPDSFARRRTRLLEIRDELGRADEPFPTGMLIPVHVDSSADPYGAAAAAWGQLTSAEEALPDRLFVAGPPAAVVEQLHTYWDLGCTEFVLAPTEQGERREEQVAMIAEQVLPELHRFS